RIRVRRGVKSVGRVVGGGWRRPASTSRRARRRARARRSSARRSAPLPARRPERLRSRRLLRSPARRGGSSLRRWLRSSCPPYALFVGSIYSGRVLRSESGATQLCYLDENLRQAIRHVDHGVVAAGQLVDAPRGVGLEPLLHAVERDAGVALGADISLLGDALARAGDGDLVGKRRE